MSALSDTTSQQRAFLSYDEELALCDDIYERRLIRDRMNEKYGKAHLGKWSADMLTTDEALVWEKGARAAAVLVDAYQPVAWAVANKVAEGFQFDQRFDVDDLFQEAVLGMYDVVWGFDARGKSRHDPSGYPGVRFGTYCRRHITKRVQTFTETAGHHLTVAKSLVYSTWKYRVAALKLEQSLGRTPTPQEVHEQYGIAPHEHFSSTPESQFTLSLDAHSPGTDEGATLHGAMPGNYVIDSAVEDAMTIDGDVMLLRDSLSDIIGHEYAKALMVRLGVDRGYARTIDECAQVLDMPKSNAQRVISAACVMVRHPNIRFALTRHIRHIADNLDLSVPGDAN